MICSMALNPFVNDYSSSTTPLASSDVRPVYHERAPVPM